MSDDSPSFVAGLAGIAAAKSRVCFLDGNVGNLQYRGFPIQTLAENASYEEVVFLLFEDVHWGDPTSSEFLDGLIARAGELKFMIVITTRPDVSQIWRDRFTQWRQHTVSG